MRMPLVTAFSAPPLGRGGSFLFGQNGLKWSRGGGLSKVQCSFISLPLHIFASMKDLQERNEQTSRFFFFFHSLLASLNRVLKELCQLFSVTIQKTKIHICVNANLI